MSRESAVNMHHPIPPLYTETVFARPAAKEADFGRLLMVIWRGRALVLAIALGAAVLSLLVWAEFPNRYRATATLLVNHDPGTMTNGRPTDIVSARTRADTMAVLSSTALAERVVARLDLSAPGAYFSPGRPSLLTLLRAGPLVAGAPEATIVAGDIARHITFNPVKGSGALAVVVTAPKPAVAQDIANTLASAHADHVRESAAQKARSAADWLVQKAAALAADIAQKEDALAEAREILSARTGGSSETTERRRAEVRAALLRANTRHATLNVTHERLLAGDMGATFDLAGAKTAARLEQEAGRLMALDAQLETVAPKHPRRVHLPGAIDNIKTMLRAELDLLATGVAAERTALGEEIAALERALSALDAADARFDREAAHVRALGRELTASRAAHDALLARLNTPTDEGGAAVRLLSPAQGAVARAGPPLLGVLSLALLLGAGAGVGTVLTRESVRKSLLSEEDVSGVTDQKILATLPAVSGVSDARALITHVRKNPSDPLAEAVRELRTSVMAADGPRVVLFCGPGVGVGSSVSAFLFALSARRMGKRTIVVDCDLRRRTLSTLARVGHGRPDLSAVIAGGAAIEEAVVPSAGVDLLLAHPVTREDALSPADRLASEGFSSALAALCASYDLVVLDAPPVGEFADARILAPRADRVVLVVRAGLTTRPALEAALDALTSVSAPVAGLAFGAPFPAS